MGHILTGAYVAEESATALHALGSRYVDEDGREFIYLQADEAVTGIGYAVVVENDWGAQMVDTTSTADHRGALVAFPQLAITSGYFFWGQVFGEVTGGIRVAASAAAGAQLNSTATGGVLDDDATAGAEVIDGVYISATDGGSGSALAGFLAYPKVGRTL
jgi:hypothetical protein